MIKQIQRRYAVSATHLLTRSTVLAGLAVVLFAAGAANAAEPQPAKSLYDRLGGAYPISVVVDRFIELLLVNDVLNANPAIKAARDRVPAAGLKFYVTGLVCQQTGGPCKYTGRGMKQSHVHLNQREGVAGDAERLSAGAEQLRRAREGAAGTDHHRGKHEEGHRGQEVGLRAQAAPRGRTAFRTGAPTGRGGGPIEENNDGDSTGG
jgi:hemoglobin